MPLQPLVLVGPGRLGRSVAALLTQRGRPFQLVGRGVPIPPAVLTWILVPDRAISVVARAVPSGQVVLHASGALDTGVLGGHPHAGSLHPLMTFPGPEAGLPPAAETPAGIAGDPSARDAAWALAEAIGWRPFLAPPDRRLYHAAAVMAGNFATTLLGESARVLAAAGIDPQAAPGLLAPLAVQSLRNAAAVGPARALTGPIARGDRAVVEQHRQALLDALPMLLPLYEILAAHTATLSEHAIEIEDLG